MSVAVLGPKAGAEDARRPREATSYPYGSRALTTAMISHGPQDGRQFLRNDETASAELEDRIEAHGLLSPDANREEVNAALLAAAQHGNADILTRLLATNRSTREGRANALARAAAFGRTRAVAVLLEASAALHDDDDAPLRNASRNGHLLVVEQLLAAGSSIDALDGYALHAAAYEGHHDVVERLLAAGANVHCYRIAYKPATARSTARKRRGKIFRRRVAVPPGWRGVYPVDSRGLTQRACTAARRAATPGSQEHSATASAARQRCLCCAPRNAHVLSCAAAHSAGHGAARRDARTATGQSAALSGGRVRAAERDRRRR